MMTTTEVKESMAHWRKIERLNAARVFLRAAIGPAEEELGYCEATIGIVKALDVVTRKLAEARRDGPPA